MNHGVTQTYLIVKTSRRKSFTGIASKTVTAKNWKVMYCKRLVFDSSFSSNSSATVAHCRSFAGDIK